ncbi:hypothetical protein ACU8V7_15730 [Zobellia nedashkovskayae]
MTNLSENDNVNVVVGTSAQESTFRTTILNGGPTTINDIRYSEFDFLANQDVSNISGNKNTSSQGTLILEGYNTTIKASIYYKEHYVEMLQVISFYLQKTVGALFLRFLLVG